MPKRISAVFTLCLLLPFSVADGGGLPSSGPCAARVDEIRVERTAFDHYNLLVKTVFLGADGECAIWIQTPDSGERRHHQGRLRCAPGSYGKPVWVTLDFGPTAAYSSVPGTRRFMGTWSAETISGTW